MPALHRAEPTAIADAMGRQRLAMGLTVCDAARLTGLRPAFIRAIERGDLQQLPSGPHGTLVFRAYAKFLNLDVSTSTGEVGGGVSTPPAIADARPPMRTGFQRRGASISPPRRPVRGGFLVLAGLIYAGALGYSWSSFLPPRSDASTREIHAAQAPAQARGGVLPERMAETPPTRRVSAPQPRGHGEGSTVPSGAGFNGDRQIVLHAVDRVRVWIREPGSHRPLVERTLRAGESLPVPRRSWLTLDVSAAQNLQIEVGGERTSSIMSPQQGMVRGIQLTRALGTNTNAEYGFH